MESQASPEPPALPDAVRVQILATEHWSLLATRNMTWNELFTRTSMFITVLSAAVVSLALFAQATDFNATFRLVALLVLAVLLLLGIGTFIRVADAMTEDVFLVMGMNRLRHAYLTIAPDLAPYFVTGHHDDIDGFRQTSGPQAQVGSSRMLAATPTIVAIVNSVVSGVIGALVARIVTNDPDLVTVSGVLVGAGVAVLLAIVIPMRHIQRSQALLVPRFPH